MEPHLNISGLFRDEQDLHDVIRKRKICFDSEPYYLTGKGQITQIGYQLNLYATFPDPKELASPDDREFGSVLRDVRRLAEALMQTCNPIHMCDYEIVDDRSVSYSNERKMRPDVTVHIPIYDQQNFGHAVDAKIRNALETAGKMLEAAGAQKTRWHEEK